VWACDERTIGSSETVLIDCRSCCKNGLAYANMLHIFIILRAYAGQLRASPSLLPHISLSAASENKTLTATKPPASSKSVPQVSQLKNNRTKLSDYLSSIISARNACSLLNFDMNVNFDFDCQLLFVAVGDRARSSGPCTECSSS
jgi:hypothetical protein